MCERVRFLMRLYSGAVALLFAAVAVAQTPPILVQTIPAGLKPLGVDLLETSTGFIPINIVEYWAAVANSGDNSVSIFKVSADESNLANISLSSVISGIPSPYAVVACSGKLIVTSPSANLVSFIDPVKGD